MHLNPPQNFTWKCKNCMPLFQKNLGLWNKSQKLECLGDTYFRHYYFQFHVIFFLYESISLLVCSFPLAVNIDKNSIANTAAKGLDGKINRTYFPSENQWYLKQLFFPWRQILRWITKLCMAYDPFMSELAGSLVLIQMKIWLIPLGDISYFWIIIHAYKSFLNNIG